MPPTFIPRQRKHKVLARQKSVAGLTDSAPDTNSVELVPATKIEIEEKNREARENLEKNHTQARGKKAKRLEKYIETKLRKDENRELILRLTRAKSDTSLYHSSSRLGQGKETRKLRLERAIRGKQAGVDIDRCDETFIDSKLPRENEAEEILRQPDILEPSQESNNSNFGVKGKIVSVGSGLKRPLEISENGQPLLKKRKRRGGVKYKYFFENRDSVNQNHSEWEGFSSDSQSSTGLESCRDYELSDFSDMFSRDKSGKESSGDEAISSKENENESCKSSIEDEGTTIKERSNAFKAWANQQINEALGYKPISNVCMETKNIKVNNFKSRTFEDDPLPMELQPTRNINRKSYSVTVNRSTHIQQMRLQLPVVADEQKIMEAVHNNPITVIYGTTGSGKTTQVPQFLFEAGYGSPESSTPGMIGVTQPRRVAAVSMAKRIGDEMDCHNKVAYQIRFEGTVGPETAIKLMTDGVLLREISQDIALRRYSAIVIDEAHERSVNTDILIGMLSRIVKLREEMAAENHLINPLKLIIMSATLRITDFTENNNLFPSPPPVLKVEGRQYDVTCHFARKTSHNYIDEAFKKVSKGHQKLPAGGFLVFLTSQNEISQLSKRLKKAFRTGNSVSSTLVKISGRHVPIETEDIDLGEIIDDDDDYNSKDDKNDVDLSLADDDFNIGEEGTGPPEMYILPLYSLLPTKEQLKVFEPPPTGSRLVVLATNIAETSLTIPGIRYVFDCGRSKERKYEKVSGVQSFEVGWISKASAHQRAGRAGRTNSGHCYRLYSSAVFERDFPEFSEPEILRTPIEGVVLQLKSMNLQNVINFPFPTPPNRNMLQSSERLLKYLSAISATGKITRMGSTMSIFPLSPRFSRILLVGHLHDCLPYSVALVAGLSVSEVFLPENQVVPKETINEEIYPKTSELIEEDFRVKIKRKFNQCHKGFCFLDEKSDAIKLLQVIGEFAYEPTEAWCQAHFVRYKKLKEISYLRKQISDLLRVNIDAFAALKYEEKLNPPSEKQVKMLKQMVAAGFIDHVAIRADMSPSPPEMRKKQTRAIDVPYLTLFPSNFNQNEEDHSVYIHSESPLAHLSPQECPKYVIYSHLQRAVPAVTGTQKIPKTRMHCLTDITGNQLTSLAKGTPLLHYGKPFKEVLPKIKSGDNANIRECWLIPYLRPEGVGGLGWPLPVRKVTQKRIPGIGWTVE